MNNNLEHKTADLARSKSTDSIKQKLERELKNIIDSYDLSNHSWMNKFATGKLSLRNIQLIAAQMIGSSRQFDGVIPTLLTRLQYNDQASSLIVDNIYEELGGNHFIGQAQQQLTHVNLFRIFMQGIGYKKEDINTRINYRGYEIKELHWKTFSWAFNPRAPIPYIIGNLACMEESIPGFFPKMKAGIIQACNASSIDIEHISIDGVPALKFWDEHIGVDEEHADAMLNLASLCCNNELDIRECIGGMQMMQWQLKIMFDYLDKNIDEETEFYFNKYNSLGHPEWVSNPGIY